MKGGGSSLLVKVLGFGALLLHGDPLVLDRWFWLRRRLGQGPGSLLDIGSGNGAFSIGAAGRGFDCLGLTFQSSEVAKASERASIVARRHRWRGRRRLRPCGTARFEDFDVRDLGSRSDLAGRFDVALCFENLEHLLDDQDLLSAIAATLRPGGRLLLTTPNLDYRPIDLTDRGPWLPIEDGRHVRKGYTHEQLVAMAEAAGLYVTECSSCSGWASQRLTGWQRAAARRSSPILGWLAILPFRLVPPLLDPLIRVTRRWPDYSLCLVARRPG